MSNHLKKFVDSVYRHYDKIILGLLLLLLAVVMVLQTANMDKTSKAVSEIRKETGSEILSKGPILRFDPDTTKVDLSSEGIQSLLWQPSYSVGPMPDFPANRSGVSRKLSEYARSQGPGSLFDPVAYVYPIDYNKSLLGYETVISPFTRLEDIPAKGPEIPFDPKLPPKPPQEKSTYKQPLEYTYLYQTQQKTLEIILKGINAEDEVDKSTWTIQVNVGPSRAAAFLKIGSTIPDIGRAGEEYKIADAGFQSAKRGNLIVQIPWMTISAPDGQILRGRQGMPVSEGTPLFTFLYFYPVDCQAIQIRSKKPGDEFTLQDPNSPTRVVRVRVLGEGETPGSVQLVTILADDTEGPVEVKEQATRAVLRDASAACKALLEAATRSMEEEGDGMMPEMP